MKIFEIKDDKKHAVVNAENSFRGTGPFMIRIGEELHQPKRWKGMDFADGVTIAIDGETVDIKPDEIELFGTGVEAVCFCTGRRADGSWEWRYMAPIEWLRKNGLLDLTKTEAQIYAQQAHNGTFYRNGNEFIANETVIIPDQHKSIVRGYRHPSDDSKHSRIVEMSELEHAVPSIAKRLPRKIIVPQGRMGYTYRKTVYAENEPVAWLYEDGHGNSLEILND